MKFVSIPTVDVPEKYRPDPNDAVDPVETAIILTECMRLPNIRVLEIGTNKGITTGNMARVIKPAGGRLVTVDVTEKSDTLPHEQRGEVPGVGFEVASHLPEEFKDFVVQELIDPNDLTSLVRVCDKHIEQHGKFDLVFIDGDHSYQGVAHDWQVVARRIELEGVALFHDVWWDVTPPPVDGPLKLMREKKGTVLNLSHIARIIRT